MGSEDSLASSHLSSVSSDSLVLRSHDYNEIRLAPERQSKRIQFEFSDNENNIRLLSTLVPDEIIYLDKTSQVKQKIHTGVLFFADVSGFTDLCERFTKQGKGGASRITKVLNEYIGVMVQEIMSHNGDILNFSGDAFLALWKIKDYTSSMSDVVHAAIDCALGIQKSHGQYKTDVGIILKVKIALAAGQIIVLVIGDNNFMVLGNAMFDVKDVGNICNPGDIIISPTVKVFIENNQYLMEGISGIPFIKILGIGSEWSPGALSHPFDMFDTLQLDKNISDEFDSDTSLVSGQTAEYGFTYALRPSIDYAVDENMENYLRKFIIPPVIRAVDLGEPLENLTEMRQVVIVFINILTRVFNLEQLEDLLEHTYTNVCDMVSSTGGCMNKVSMFDKDLMFLVIYGLRGFKHKLQAQQALYCAKRIREKLVKTREIVSASVGVAVGATYCGVVGHPMRKEYTVIGRTVNKAARLMMAYPDMVTCDRETFLESQLQSRYFTLQPIRYLKGFTNVGPIYKFDDDCSEEHIIEREMLKTNTYPILDRPKELELFFGLLHIKIPNHSAIELLRNNLCTDGDLYQNFSLNPKIEYNMVIIKGAARRGKTRVLNEIAYFVKSEIPHYKCTLDKNSRQYKIFRCILCEGCKITNVKDMHTRTKYVWRTLMPFRVPEFLCALNDMLYVNFEVSEHYTKLSSDQQLYVRRKMVKYLSNKIFKTFSLITIDNMEYLDTESWILYNEIINCGTIFTCATISTNANLCEESKQITEAASTVATKLKPIYEWYHSALICQFLNVRGISLELEKYVQEHSFGNPGWIESFLTTLRHSTILKKVDMEKSHAFEQGYVLPDTNLLKRQDNRMRHATKSYENFTQHSLKTNSNFAEKITSSEMEGWDIYQQTIPNISDEYLSSELITICTLSRDIGLNEIDTEEHVDLHMLRIYDSLNVQEQHVLKCSAILGEEFKRTELEYVMQSNYDRKTAIAIRRLFEMNVFGCLRASYNNGDVTVNHYKIDPHLDKEVKCECEGFPEELNYKDLPKYASCAYICFREPAFRKMCMNLLTETQANLYHLRAIWYLENETRRCYSCGMGYFARINGQIHDDGMKKYSIEVLTYGKTHSLTNLAVSSKKRNSSIYLDFDFDDDIRNKKHVRRTINARTFEDNNLIGCRCVDILINMYSEIIEHNQEIGRYEALMNSMLEYAELCIRANNNSVAFTLIAKASNLLDEKLKNVYAEPAWQVPLTKGRILTLRGRLHIKRKDYEQSEKSLLLALQAYNLSFPKTKLAVNAAIVYHKYRQKIIFIYFPNKYIGSDDDDVRILAEQTADTLCALHALFLLTGRYEKAHLASIWGLTEALRSNSNFYLNCVAYRNILRVEILYPRPDIINRIEDMALEMCYKKHSRLELHEFEAVVKMYSILFIRKGAKENLLTGLTLGATIIKMNSPKYGGYYSWRVTPFFIRCLTFTYNIKELVKLILEMLAAQTLPSIKGLVPTPMRTYVMAMHFMCVTTYSVIPLSVCKSCFSIKIEPTGNKTLTNIEMRYYTMIWLWHLRKEEWESSANIFNQISETNLWPRMKDPEMSYCVAVLLEGLLLLFVNKIDSNNIPYTKYLERFILHIMDILKEHASRLLILKSRFYLLKAHYNMICNKKKIAQKLLNKAEDYADRFSNYFEGDWVNHNRKAWNNWPNSVINDKWIRAAQVEKLISECNDFDERKMPMFTLRLPILQTPPLIAEINKPSLYKFKRNF